MESVRYIINGTSYDQLEDASSDEQEAVQLLQFTLLDTPPLSSLHWDTRVLRVDYEAVSMLWSPFGSGGVFSRTEAIDALGAVDTWTDAPVVDLNGTSDLTTRVVNQQQAMILSQMYLVPLPEAQRTRLENLITQDVDSFFEEIRGRDDETPFRAITVSKDDGHWTFDVTQSMTLTFTYRDDPDAKARIEMSRRVVWDEEVTIIDTDSACEMDAGDRFTPTEIAEIEDATASIVAGTFKPTSSSTGCSVVLPAVVILLAILAILVTQCA